ncbi:DUF6920 family protein [Qipengyuania sphaerica]|uniref:DUF6920 family protein n=1 Tax=Qipengyuania sphaerica TaxID=2867243 RepID=UPI001C8723AD|nr:DUF6544 family protein [Qipengyuania sphaerica]MBX7541409.1 hypothetical protein [Qipengyuania sphaerica]
MALPHPIDPPEEARALAARLGVLDPGKGVARFRQSGRLRNIGREKWMAFSARQMIECASCAFDWRARVGPLGAIHVEDSLHGDTPSGRVSIAGLVTLDRAAASPDLLKGQLMRYLAELPWCPTAILANRDLRWSVTDKDELRVSTQSRGVCGEVTFKLNDAGLPVRVEGLRPAMEQDGYVERLWIGEFSEFRQCDGYTVPHEAAVSWVLEGSAFEVWRGKLSDWRMT